MRAKTFLRGSRAALAALLIATGLIAATPRPAWAVHVECGMVITTSGVDITLDRDVGPCATDGIIIRADNVTLNLNGFDVFGDTDPTTDNVGIRIEGTQNQVVDCAKPFDSVPPCSPGRQDSEVRDFNLGILIEGGSSNEVCRTTVRRNIGLGDIGDGIVVHDSNSNTIVNNTVDFNGHFSGVTLLGESDGNKVGVPLGGNAPDIDGASLRTTCDGGNTISNNVSQLGPNDIGIRIEPEAQPTLDFPNGNTIENNVVSNNALDGISIFAIIGVDISGSTSNAIKSNTITGNGAQPVSPRRGDGIRLNGRRGEVTSADNTVIEGNTVSGNAANGIVVNSSSNNIKGNVISGNGFTGPVGNGILIANDGNVVNNANRISGNAGDGILLTNMAIKNEIKQNSVINNRAGNGIRTQVGSVHNNIMNNTATGNGVAPASYDLNDENPNADPQPVCESNHWQSNDEITKNQPCID